MSEGGTLLERQARWQTTRQSLSWPEKIRMAEAIRDSVRTLRQVRPDSSTMSKATASRPPLPAE